ncbi:LysR substrate-binding domain-containing protein [Caulobacter sp. RL271]|uniref:LysR substrate-binding domain-containing protein n=1 Tax=Caulobacter segnis TaxID=88688 RepID=A0ABY4ZYX9_9CAUL|nr:LysR substrate-binding domain-containing protein [Caulobacter segnis]USQ97197.1 LysR substrate-binding domain-containing protein [Caulobacter segnis]
MPNTTNLDLDLLRAFVMVSESRNFTRAGERLGRSQSAVSLQVRRLEDLIGEPLFQRDARRVSLTDKGEVFLAQARRLLRVNDDIVAALAADEVEGEVRLGAPEDFATAHLPAVLGAFARSHPRIALSVTCDLTLRLLDRMSAGDLDLALVKREPLGGELGVRVWREPLVWVGQDSEDLASGKVVSLIAAPSPCVYRRRATTALDEAGRAWRIAYTSPSVAGQLAALRAGLGVSVLPRAMVPDDLTILGQAAPPLADGEIALIRNREAGPAADRLAEHVLTALDRAVAHRG